jgi:hypothetical protein
MSIVHKHHIYRTAYDTKYINGLRWYTHNCHFTLQINIPVKDRHVPPSSPFKEELVDPAAEMTGSEFLVAVYPSESAQPPCSEDMPTWMSPEYIMLNEISQAQKDKYYMLSFIYGN